MNKETQQLVEASRVRPGDFVEIVGMGCKWFEVLDATDPALLLVESPSGKQFKTGRLCVTAARRQGDT